MEALTEATQAYIVAIANQKGGVGKTATTINLAGALAEEGHNVLIIDLDPQGHLTAGVKIPTAPVGQPNIYGALIGEYTGSLTELIVTHSVPEGRIDVVPSTLEMFMAVRSIDKVRAREHRLAAVLTPVRENYDFILIDAPPSLDILTDNALVAADGVLIPVQAEDSTLKALELILPQIAAVDAELRTKPLELLGLVVNLLRRPVTNIAESVLDELAKLEGLPILATISQSVTVTEAWRFGRTVVAYRPDSEHAEEYRKLAGVVSGGVR